MHQDHLSGTSLMTSANGSSLGIMKYYPYGSTRSGDVRTDIQFTGQRYDDTGLYYYNARYYDPEIGRFISADIIIPNYVNPQSLNRYSYCYNNPTKYNDPSGHWGGDPVEIDGHYYVYWPGHGVICVGGGEDQGTVNSNNTATISSYNAIVVDFDETIDVWRTSLAFDITQGYFFGTMVTRYNVTGFVSYNIDNNSLWLSMTVNGKPYSDLNPAYIAPNKAVLTWQTISGEYESVTLGTADMDLINTINEDRYKNRKDYGDINFHNLVYWTAQVSQPQTIPSISECRSMSLTVSFSIVESYAHDWSWDEPRSDFRPKGNEFTVKLIDEVSIWAN